MISIEKPWKPPKKREMWAPFRFEGKVFFQIFFYHFVENKKLHNIYKIQSGPAYFKKMAADILPKIARHALINCGSYCSCLTK
jgi:hypothetical protein